MYPHFEKTDSTTHFIVDGKPFIVLGGELHNSTSSSAAYTAQFWDKLQDMKLNTVILGASWEMVEPKEGIYDFSVIDSLIADAYSHQLKLIFIWFATWKNAASTYTPEWVQSDIQRFPRVIHIDGKKNCAISCFSEECCKADANAFGKLMKHIREIDTNRTVISVQVENECGVLGTSRDYSEKANRLFEAPIPSELAEYLDKNRTKLSPYLLENIHFDSLSETWKAVFGEAAEEAFMCYYTGKYVNQVISSGKKEYDIPMFVNSWPQQCEGEPGGVHPSGGPTSQMLDIWKCAAPDIDALAGDLYLENFPDECAAYSRPEGNPLFIPEARKDKWIMAHAFYAIANNDALCFSPFGIESIETENVMPENMIIQSIFQTMDGGDTSWLVRQTYTLLDNMMPIICRFRGTGKMKGILQNRLMGGALNFTKYSFQISYKNFIDRIDIPGGGMVIELSPDEFLVAGANFSLTALPKPGYPAFVEILSLEEGHFSGEKWVRDCKLNGDELHIVMPKKPRILKVKLFNFQ